MDRKKPIEKPGTLVSCMLLLACAPLHGEELLVSVTAADGAPVPNVAVYLPASAEPAGATPPPATMDQWDTRFVPHLLVIQAGTLVEFPNSDTVAHHVYSFSSPNNFILPLYKGDAHPPVRFEHSGVVTLGCNIHDDMLAYILVVDSPVFAITNEFGVATLDVTGHPDSDIHIWSPRLRGDDNERTAQVPAPGQAALDIRLAHPLRDPHDHDVTALAWKKY